MDPTDMHPFLSPLRQESVNTQQSRSSSGSSNSQEIQGQSFQSTEGISKSLQSHELVIGSQNEETKSLTVKSENRTKMSSYHSAEGTGNNTSIVVSHSYTCGATHTNEGHQVHPPSSNYPEGSLVSGNINIGSASIISTHSQSAATVQQQSVDLNSPSSLFNFETESDHDNLISITTDVQQSAIPQSNVTQVADAKPFSLQDSVEHSPSTSSGDSSTEGTPLAKTVQPIAVNENSAEEEFVVINAQTKDKEIPSGVSEETGTGSISSRFVPSHSGYSSTYHSFDESSQNNEVTVHCPKPPPSSDLSRPADSLVVSLGSSNINYRNLHSENLDIGNTCSTQNSLQKQSQYSNSHIFPFETESNHDDPVSDQESVNNIVTEQSNTQGLEPTDDTIDEPTSNEKVPLLSGKKIHQNGMKSTNKRKHKKIHAKKQPSESQELYVVVGEENDIFEYNPEQQLCRNTPTRTAPTRTAPTRTAPTRTAATRHSKKCWNRIIYCTLATPLVLLILSLPVIGIALYETVSFINSDNYDTPAVQGDYVSLPYTVIGTNMYQYTLHFTADNQSYPVEIYDITPSNTDRTIQVKPFNPSPTHFPFVNQSTVRFDDCSEFVGKCILGQYLYLAKNKISEIGFDLALDSFIEGVTNVRVLAFDNFEYLTEFLQTNDRSKAVKNIKFNAKNFTFAFKSDKSSYYYFVIQDIEGSLSEWFTINRIDGTHVYYNASLLTPHCLMNATNNYSCIIDDIGNTDRQFLGHITGGDKLKGMNQIFNISHRMEHPTPTVLGQIIISVVGGVFVAVLLLVCTIFTLCCWKKINRL